MFEYIKLDEFLSGDSRYIIRRDTLLSGYCTFKIGGAADYVIYPDSCESLIELIAVLRDHEIKHIVCGNASNILFPDDGYRGAVVFTRRLNKISADENTMSVHCGALLGAAAMSACRSGLKGLEFAFGIPGSCGGAVYMNAGAYGGQMSDIVLSSSYYDPSQDKICQTDCTGHRFGYRSSIFSGSEIIILSSVFRLESDCREMIRERMDMNTKHRSDHQPLLYPSAGSVFKRYPGYYTSKLIEEAGLKGRQCGRAQISMKHAGFIINLGGATASDVLNLIDIVKETVYSKYGIEIECEIRII